ncbi:MAG: hypothetical protein ABI262_21965 [Microcoleus sp.]
MSARCRGSGESLNIFLAIALSEKQKRIVSRFSLDGVLGKLRVLHTYCIAAPVRWIS